MGSKRREIVARRTTNGQRAHHSRSSSSTSRRNLCDCDSGDQIVAVMQTTEPRHGYNLATCAMIRFCFATDWRSFRQTEVRAILVIVADVVAHQTFQMTFIEDDHVVEQIPTEVSDPALGNSVLPWASKAGPLGLDAEALHHVDHFFIELRAAIKDQVAGSGVVRKRLAQLLDDPGAGRMLGHIAVQDASPVMRDGE